MPAAEAADDAGGATKNELVGSRISTVARAASSSLRIVEIMISGRVPPVVVEAFLVFVLGGSGCRGVRWFAIASCKAES